MKPTFDVHFSTEHPKVPGLWLNRRENYIGVLDVQQSDIDRDSRDTSWLAGEWGARLNVVPQDVVPLQRKQVAEFLDKLIASEHEAKRDARVDLLQFVRKGLLGESLVLPGDETATNTDGT